MNSFINKTTIISGAILLLPFIIFWWLLPGSPVTIGNDYPDYSIKSQMEYFYSISNGTFPLFVPDYWFGQTSAALPLAQIYHPVAWLTYIMPGYWEKDTLLIYSSTKLISLGTANLVLFFFFTRMGLGKFLAFICSFVVIYNLRMLDLFRYGASLETYTGFILLIVSLEYLYRDIEKYSRKLFVIFSTYLVIVSGHPQMSYYALLGAGVFLFLLPILLKNSTANKSTPTPVYFILTSSALFITGILLSSTFSLPFYFEYMQNNASRVQMPFQWTLSYAATPVSLFNNFTVPFRSEVHSAFGANALLFYGILSILLYRRLFTSKKAISLYITVAVLMLIVVGDKFFFHRFLWDYLPLYSSFRIPGRISLLLPFYIILIYSLYLKEIQTFNDRRYILGSHIVLSIIYLCLSLFSIYSLPLPAPGYTPEHLNNVSYNVEILFVVFNTILLISLGIYLSQRGTKTKYASAVTSVLMLILSTTILLYNGTWKEPYEKVVSTNILTLGEYNQRTTGLGNTGSGLESKNVRTQIDNYKFDSDHARVLPAISYINSLSEAYKHLKLHGDKDTVVIVDSTRQSETKYLCEKNCDYKIIRTCHTYNKFEYILYSTAGGVVKFNIPYSNNWLAAVDEIKTNILKANGFEMAIVIPDGGEHKIKLSYESWPFVTGIIISLTTLAIILILGIRRLQINNHLKMIIILLIVGIVVGIVISRDSWLYKGECLPQEYSWENTNNPWSHIYQEI
jgi:hypothetical protein